MHKVLGAGLLLLTLSMSETALAQNDNSPSPDSIVKKACAAAGGIEAFSKLGIVRVIVNRQETVQDGKPSEVTKTLIFSAPGPIPGRVEVPNPGVIAADDGSGGWAIVGGKPDPRQGNVGMIKRLIKTDLFPMMLPFSLTWPGVLLRNAQSVEFNGQQLWRVTVEFERSFFFTPQISTTWVVDFDRKTYALVQAICPPSDIGKGITSDGMRFTWRQPIKLGGVMLYEEQRVNAVDQTGQETAHNRLDRLTYSLLPVSEAQRLFANPIPPGQRPKAPEMPPSNFRPQ